MLSRRILRRAAKMTVGRASAPASSALDAHPTPPNNVIASGANPGSSPGRSPKHGHSGLLRRYAPLNDGIGEALPPQNPSPQRGEGGTQPKAGRVRGRRGKAEPALSHCESTPHGAARRTENLHLAPGIARPAPRGSRFVTPKRTTPNHVAHPSRKAPRSVSPCAGDRPWSGNALRRSGS